MLPVQELLANLSLINKELVIPLDTQRFFYVDPEGTKNFLDQVLEIEETDMKFFNVKQSKPYSNSLDKATIVNNSNATVTQQETFTKTTTDSYTFTNSRGLNKGAAINATIGTAFLGGVGTTLNMSFNVTNTASTAKSVATSRSQQQTITVPANTSLVATWVIKNVDIDADYKMLLKTGPKPALKHGLIPGRLVTSDQPVAPVYKYTDMKGERFMYLPSADTQIEDFFLADLNPIFYVPAPVSQSNQAIQAGGTHRGHLKNLLWKGTHTDKALVPVYPTGSSQQDTSVSMELQQSFQVNAQHSVGSVSLWRFRKLNTNEPQFKLIPSNTPEALQGWVNEGSVGFVHLNVPGMKDADTTKWGHPHALNEIQLDKDNKEALMMAAKKKLKCGKCWKKIDPSQYYKCEQCKTPFVECAECYLSSDLSAQKMIDEAATKIQESFANMGEKIKHFSIIGKMHCTQGTHTFIDISPMSESDKDQAHQHVQPPMKEVKEVTEEDTEKEKSRKSKRFVEEFKYKKAYIEEEEDKKKFTHKKTDKVIVPETLPLPPPPPPLPPTSRVTFQEPLPPPPPPLPSNFACSAPSPLGNPYFTSPMQNFINNPSTVQPYFVPVSAPAPPPAPIIHAGPIPSTTRTIETPYPLSSPSIPAPPPPPMPSNDMKNQPQPPHPPPSHLPQHMQPTIPSYRRPSVDEMYSIPMNNYSASNNPHYASPVWNAPTYAAASDPNYNQQGNYNSPQPFGPQPSYDTSLPPGYTYDSTAYPTYDAPPKNYDYDSGVNQQQANYNPNYNPSYTQSYQSSYAPAAQTTQQNGGIGGRARNFFGRRA